MTLGSPIPRGTSAGGHERSETRDRAIVAMLAAFTVFNLTLDLALVVNAEHPPPSARAPTGPPALWALYADADPPLPIVAPWSRAQEAINVFWTTGLNVWLIWAIVTRRAYRHVLELALGSYISYSVFLYWLAPRPSERLRGHALPDRLRVRSFLRHDAAMARRSPLHDVRLRGGDHPALRERGGASGPLMAAEPGVGRRGGVEGARVRGAARRLASLRRVRVAVLRTVRVRDLGPAAGRRRRAGPLAWPTASRRAAEADARGLHRLRGVVCRRRPRWRSRSRGVSAMARSPRPAIGRPIGSTGSWRGSSRTSCSASQYSGGGCFHRRSSRTTAAGSWSPPTPPDSWWRCSPTGRRGHCPADRRWSGYAVTDFFMGVKLHPRIGPLDLKLFHIGRVGMMAWTAVNASFAGARQFQGRQRPAR